MTETVNVCPECDDPDIRRQSERAASADCPQCKWEELAHRDFDRHKCYDCGAEFHEPAERKRRNHGGRRGLAGDLVDASAAEVSSDE
jgi:ssDNA-binding Zn-finger/Zn-ribbon topoisomerase 1